MEDIGATSERLYRQLQESVDKEMQNYGFVPPDGYGMAPGTDRVPRNGASANVHSGNGNGNHGAAGGGNG
ncbi:MAG TPA: hypothetical protein VGO11_14945, partial [Chthoniobacteraceae bacterium]|nr:hypothetical protein [Chthoniobacteraceae bacterium]